MLLILIFKTKNQFLSITMNATDEITDIHQKQETLLIYL